jgi:putative PIN family toxin of toxin-antitoxin system
VRQPTASPRPTDPVSEPAAPPIGPCAGGADAPAPRGLVLDTNIVLDLLVFDDPAAVPLRAALARGEWRWLATAPMRDELARVLAYPKIAARLAFRGLAAPAVLSAFDAQSQPVPVPPKAPVTCKDADDQKFIDLAVHHRATLLSKDAAVLCMKKRLQALAVWTSTAISSIA